MSKVIHNPALARIDETDTNSATFVIEPLHAGYGNTLGNSLRRVLLSSIRGGAIVAFRVEGASHEFTTVKGVKEDVVDMLLELREIQPEALPINFLLPIKGTPLGNADISQLTTEYCMKVLCLARLLVPKADIRCAAGREVYFKGEEKKLLSVVDSIFASGYLTEGGQGIEDTLKTITDAGFTYEIESA